MGRLRIGMAAAVAAAWLWPATSGAMIPPSYKILVVAPDEETEATSRALLEAMSTFNAFFWIEPDFRKSELGGCLTAPDLRACVHETVSRKPVDERARPVVIVARPVKPGLSTWACFGSGRNTRAPASGVVEIDLKTALFGPEKARSAARRKAMDCIYAAESESVES